MELKRTEDEVIQLQTKLHSIQHRRIEWFNDYTSATSSSASSSSPSQPPQQHQQQQLPSTLAEYYQSTITFKDGLKESLLRLNGCSKTNDQTKEEDKGEIGSEDDNATKPMPCGDSSSSSSSSFHNSSPSSEPDHPVSTDDLASAIESIQERLMTLDDVVTKFRQRLMKTDPVTGKPRYGEKTASRVTSMIEFYDALRIAVDTAFDGQPSSNSTQPISGITTLLRSDSILRNKELQLRLQVAEQRKQAADLLQKQREAEAAATEATAAQRSSALRLAERSELATRAEEARRNRLEAEKREREEEERRERAIIDAVKEGGKGLEGVRFQVRHLLRSDGGEGGTSITEKEQSMALEALRTLFSQIAAHPDKEEYRRIRRNHPKFQEDIGRHDGGEGVLIAAGFRFGKIDGVKCLILREPDIEKDMDGWSEWFDLMKGTVKVIEEEMVR